MNSVFRLSALCWLVFICAYLAGLYTYSTKTWPYSIVSDVENFVRGHSEDTTTLMEKITNDLDLKPTRLLEQSNLTTISSDNYKELKGLPLKPRRLPPKIFLSDTALKGYRVIYGVFDFLQHRFGAILLDPAGNVIHIWQVTQEGVAWKHEADENVFSHGFEIAPDGSIVVAFDGGTSLAKYDYCGKEVWRQKGGFHHSIAFDGPDTVWTWGGTDETTQYDRSLMKIDYNTGKILNKFNIFQVINANLDIDIFGMRQKDEATGSTWVWEGGLAFHPNDIDPLPKNLERFYPQFKAGDLLVSLRSPNLVFVLDPDTLKVKWWRQGLTRRQHDPDWNKQGTITIFNNNMHRNYSTIVEIDPKTFKADIILDGRDYDFYTWMRGKHQLLPDNGMLITSPQQGRIFEVDGSGNITFEFINLYDKQNEVLVTSEARFLPLDFFNEFPQCN